jgi:hypothetical protein
MQIYLSHRSFPDDPGIDNIHHTICGLPNKKTKKSNLSSTQVLWFNEYVLLTHELLKLKN